MLWHRQAIFIVKLVQYTVNFSRTGYTAGLVLQHQGISSPSAEYASMHIQLFIGGRYEVEEFYQKSILDIGRYGDMP